MKAGESTAKLENTRQKAVSKVSTGASGSESGETEVGAPWGFQISYLRFQDSLQKMRLAPN